MFGRGVCAILHCCKKARVSIRSPLSCSKSLWQGFAASPTRRLQESTAKAGAGQRPPRGGKKYLREKFSNPTSNGKKKRRERERERGREEVCVRVYVSVCPAERKCQLSHKCPTSLPNGRQLVKPPVILATIRTEDKDIAHWNTTMSKIRKLLIFFT